MTKKDYVFIGNIIKQFKGELRDPNKFVFILNTICVDLKNDNPRFDSDKFISYLLED